MAEPFYFLNIYKEKGITSFDVIYKLRKILGTKKIGHSGTLDPMAQGVLQVAVGGATRLIEYLDSDKEYIADIKFGFLSSTLDSEGEIMELEEKPKFKKNELEKTLLDFTGKIEQAPPKYSAIKLNGKKLCNIARKNPDIQINIPKRIVSIYKISLLDAISDSNGFIKEAKIFVSCSCGTYIRTLADDIAKKIGTRGYLTALKRIKAGKFEIKKSILPENIDIEKNAIEPSLALSIKQYELNEDEFQKVRNGVSINIDLSGQNEYIMLLYNKKLVSIGLLSDNAVKIKKFFNRES